MQDSRDSDVPGKLRTLAAQNPREARVQFCQMLDTDSPDLPRVLNAASAPGEGRVRQLIANAVRGRPDKAKVIPDLLRWLESETDEFAKRAIAAALEDVNVASFHDKPATAIADPKLVETFRYVKERLCHELRNALLMPRTQILRLKAKVEGIGDGGLRGELSMLLGQLGDAFTKVGNIVEFDADESHFKLRPVSVCGWLEAMNVEYGRKYQPISLTINSQLGKDEDRIVASDYLLRIIFWNLWINAQQAVQGDCRIVVRATINGRDVQLLVSDNGSGFPPEMVGVAFYERYSQNGAYRGRGLLEVQDAVQRLRGKAQLEECRSGEFRILLSFPLEAP